MTVLWRASPCGCTHPAVLGSKRPKKCPCGNPFTRPDKGLKRSNLNQIGKPGKKRSTLKRSQRRESRAERAARLHFNEVVKGRRCFFIGRRDCPRCSGSGIVYVPPNRLFHPPREAEHRTCWICNGTGSHVCSPPKDAHHLVRASWIKCNFADLPEAELLAILYSPLIGCPLCRAAHDPVTAKTQRIYFNELTPECIEFCEEVDRRYLEVLTPAGVRRASMVEELRRECPVREVAHV